MSFPEASSASSRAVVQVPLSVCCVTHVSPQQTRASIDPLRGVASEIVVGLDQRLTARAREYEEFADRVLVLPSGVVERNLAEIHQACTHDWILRIDSDETVSPALLAALPRLLADDDVRQYAIARRWIVDDGAHWVDEAPWWPDFQIRLVRSGGARFSGHLHSSAELEVPRAFVIEPLLHLDCMLQSASARQAKVLDYEVRRPGGPGTMREPVVRFYEPERFARRAPVPLEGDERSAVRAFLGETAARMTRWAPRPSSEPSGGAAPGASGPDAEGHEVAFELLERDLRFEMGACRAVSARVTNLSESTWEHDAQPGAGMFLTSRWRWADGAELEGVRTPFPTTLKPGDTCVARIDLAPPERSGPVWLDLAVVDEHVRWVPGEQRVDAVVDPPAAVPVRRELRPPRKRRWGVRPARDDEIPRVLHRIWLGDAPMPHAHVAFGHTWQRLHPSWEMRLWTDADAPDPPGVERARNVGERSDLVRYEILRRHGGVYVDTDVECLRAVDELLEGVTAFAAYEVPGRVCNAVIGAMPGHAAFTRAVELAEVTVGHGTYPEATATTFLTYVLERFEDVTLFGPERFYPTLWEGTQNVGDDAPYAAHHWARSWEGQRDGRSHPEP